MHSVSLRKMFFGMKAKSGWNVASREFWPRIRNPIGLCICVRAVVELCDIDAMRYRESSTKPQWRECAKFHFPQSTLYFKVTLARGIKAMCLKLKMWNKSEKCFSLFVHFFFWHTQNVCFNKISHGKPFTNSILAPTNRPNVLEK